MDGKYTLDGLSDKWNQVHSQIQSWAASLSEAQVDEVLTGVNMAGKPFELPIWQVILHVVNHATFHRGQVTTMLRQLNHVPILMDYAAYKNWVKG